jgi:aryl-alcohol dehydrogenase-like predicted oxidoreductase
VAKGARFGFLNQVEGMTGPQAALAYVLANPNIACAVIGTTRPAHLQENLAASGMILPADVAARIRGFPG